VQTIREYLSKLGRKGGKVTAERRTAEERSEAARKAVLARWTKRKKQIERSLPKVREATEAVLGAEAVRTNKVKKKQRAAKKP
jgi:hypothetical protein